VNKKVTIGDRELTENEIEELYYCISCRLGIIETGTPNMRAIDAENAGEKKKIKVLSTEQKKLTIMLEEIMYSLL
jgi:hypothetical protein